MNSEHTRGGLTFPNSGPSGMGSSSAIELVPLVSLDGGREQDNTRQSSQVALADLSTTANSPQSSFRRLQKEATLLPPASLEKPSMLQRCVLDTWTCEVVALIFSIGCIIVITIIASFYNGKPASQLPTSVTLNTMVAVLSTSARSALMFVASAAVGQLKWCWLRRSSRKLQDMQAIDEASRGSLGALRSLASWTGGVLTALGSMIILLLIAFGPFLQQLVEYQTRPLESNGTKATIPQNLNYTILRDPEPRQSYPEFEAAVNAGLHFGPEVFRLQASCPTAHCTWHTFKTIGWCSKCEDVTESSVLDNCTVSTQFAANASQPFCQVTIPIDGKVREYTRPSIALLSFRRQSGNNVINGLDYTTEVMWHVRFSLSAGLATLIEDEEDEFEVNGITYPSLTLGHVIMERDYEAMENYLSSDTAPLRLKSASRCVLTLCEREYTVTTLDGIANLDLLNTNYGVFSRPYHPTHVDAAGKVHSRELTCWQPEDGDMDLVSTDGNFTYLDQKRHAFCPAERYGSTLGYIIAFDSTMAWYYDPERISPEFNKNQSAPYRFANVSERLEHVAASLTSYGLGASKLTHEGTAYVSETFVRVRWWWILFPAILQFGSAVLLLLTILYSHRIGAPLWKSSVLAFYYHRLGDSEPTTEPFVEKLSGMDTAARETTVRLH